VIFDLGRVLVPFDFRIGYQRMSAVCGLAPEEIRARIGTDGMVRDFEAGHIDGAGFHRRVEELLETRIERAQFDEIWSSIFLPETLVPESFVAALHARYRSVLLSNTNDIHFNFVAAHYPILKHFDAYVLSHEVKAMKPEPAIYEAAIHAAGCPAGECFFTDDVAEYVAGACRAGIDAVQFQGYEALCAALRERGVAWDA
jgi:FMN phosphatase YigB (HAD superfamily)